MICDQKFKWMTSLQIHQTIHTQNKTLVPCKTCSKPFFNIRTLERHQKIHNNVKFQCTLCAKDERIVVSSRKDNIRRHIKHLHAEIEKSEISSKITEIQSIENVHIEEIEDDDDDDIDSEQAELGTDNDLENDDTVPYESIEEPLKPPSPLPVINNRVNVIQSVGNPNKHHQQQTPQSQQETPPEPRAEEAAGAANETTLVPQLPQKPQEEKIEIKLPPKKKLTATIQPSPNPVVVPQKPKYDPIEHYRKILLGTSNDDEHPPAEDNHESHEDSDHETQVFPVHWRKRTSQNFLFRR